MTYLNEFLFLYKLYQEKSNVFSSLESIVHDKNSIPAINTVENSTESNSILKNGKTQKERVASELF
jgi:hypothetical protein